MQIGDFKITKQLIILIALLPGILIGVYLVQKTQIFKSRASVSNSPFEIYQGTTQQKINCDNNRCVATSLDIVIKPQLGNQPNTPVRAIVKAPQKTPTPTPSATPVPVPNSVDGAVILDPGHGDPDLVDVEHKTPEGKLNLVIAQRAREFLQQEGVTAFLTHEKNLGFTNKYDDLQTRADRINDFTTKGAKMFLAIHFDSGNYSVRETRAYYNNARTFSNANYRLAQIVSAAVARRTGASSGTALDRQTDTAECQGPLFILGRTGERSCHSLARSQIQRETQIPGILVEYLSNGVSYDSIRQDNNLVNNIAKGYCDGALQYLADRNCR